MRDKDRPPAVTDARPSLSDRQRRRRRWYFALMGGCLVLILLAWNVVRLFSPTAAIVMSAVAAVLPPLAAFVANRDVEADAARDGARAGSVRSRQRGRWSGS